MKVPSGFAYVVSLSVRAPSTSTRVPDRLAAAAAAAGVSVEVELATEVETEMAVANAADGHDATEPAATNAPADTTTATRRRKNPNLVKAHTPTRTHTTETFLQTTPLRPPTFNAEPSQRTTRDSHTSAFTHSEGAPRASTASKPTPGLVGRCSHCVERRGLATCRRGPLSRHQTRPRGSDLGNR